MVKPPFHLFEIEVEVFPGNPTVVVEPVFRIRLEALTTIEMISALRFALFLSDHHMVTAEIEKGVCAPIIGIVQPSLVGFVIRGTKSRFPQRGQSMPSSALYRKPLEGFDTIAARFSGPKVPRIGDDMPEHPSRKTLRAALSNTVLYWLPVRAWEQLVLSIHSDCPEVDQLLSDRIS